jgi:carboxyl-terminal processing protease
MLKKSKILLLLLIIFLLSQSLLAKDNSRINADLIIEIYKSAEKHFAGDVNRQELFKGTFDSIKSFLKKKNCSADIKEIEITDNKEADLKLFASRLDEIISTCASEELPQGDILREGLDGMLKSLNDPYSYYMDPGEYKNFVTSINMNDYSGIGIYLELDKKNGNKPVIIEVIENGPAYKAGLKPGDIILKLNGLDTTDISMEEAVKEVRGLEGTNVVLTVKREKPEEFTVTRGVIHIDNVSHNLINKSTGYIKIRSFSVTTGTELGKAMEQLKSEGAKAYILDLRNNGGGYVESAVSVCSNFLPKDSKIVTVKEKSSFPLIYKSEGTDSDLPLAILVNEYSASASEITAGAIQDNKRGVLIGTRTFGKGCVQTIYPLGISGVLKITTSYYVTPLGRNIDKSGLTPDIEVKINKIIEKESDDLQLQKAIEYLSKKI